MSPAPGPISYPAAKELATLEVSGPCVAATPQARRGPAGFEPTIPPRYRRHAAVMRTSPRLRRPCLPAASQAAGPALLRLGVAGRGPHRSESARHRAGQAPPSSRPARPGRGGPSLPGLLGPRCSGTRAPTPQNYFSVTYATIFMICINLMLAHAQPAPAPRHPHPRVAPVASAAGCRQRHWRPAGGLGP